MRRFSLHFIGLNFICLVATDLFAADFGKRETTWEHLGRGNSASETWGLGSEGYMTYTQRLQPGEFPTRHSYTWLHFFGNYQIVPGYQLNGMLTLQKMSFSYDLDSEPFRLRAFPQLSFDGSLRQMLPLEFLPENGHKMHLEAGTVPMFRHGQGLYYSQFTGVGFFLRAETDYVSLELAQLGYGYYDGDDVHSVYIYGPQRIIGVGVLHEFNTPLGDRVVPGVAGEARVLSNWRFFYEGGVSFLYRPSYATRYAPYSGIQGYENYYIDLSRPTFSQQFALNDRTASGLVGIDFATSRLGDFVDRLLFSQQVRYHGGEATDFYEQQRKSHFYYYTDVTTDQRYNNQPYNFYLFPGSSLGLYLLQEVEILPWRMLRLTLRNELLIVHYENRYPGTSASPRSSGNDLLSIVAAMHIDQRLNMGVKLSNVLIGNLEYGTAEVLVSRSRTPLMLEASGTWLLDFFLRYKI